MTRPRMIPKLRPVTRNPPTPKGLSLWDWLLAVMITIDLVLFCACVAKCLPVQITPIANTTQMKTTNTLPKHKEDILIVFEDKVTDERLITGGYFDADTNTWETYGKLEKTWVAIKWTPLTEEMRRSIE